MNGIRSYRHGSSNDPFHIQIAVLCRRRTDTDGLVRQLCVQSLFIRLGANRYRKDVHLTAGPDNAHRDLSSVCN